MHILNETCQKISKDFLKPIYNNPGSGRQCMINYEECGLYVTVLSFGTATANELSLLPRSLPAATDTVRYIIYNYIYSRISLNLTSKGH